MTWRIAHVSDCHFCATPRRANLWKFVKRRIREANGEATKLSPDTIPTVWLPESHCPEVAEFLARKIFLLRDQIDLLVITGDIATTGLTEDLKIGHAYSTNQPKEAYFDVDGNATVWSGRFPILLMPGNHDRYKNNDGEPNCRTFDLLFTGHWGPKDPNIATIILKRPQSVTLAIIAADFTLRTDADASPPRRWMRYGQGYAYDDVVERLILKTSELRDRFSDIGIIWAIHFPPTKECSGFCGYLELRYHNRVIGAAYKSKISIILAGHIHDRKLIRLGGLDIVCAGSACVFEEKQGNWLHLMEIEIKNGAAQLIQKTDYQWSDADGDFV